jgi:hypothetical protein
MLSKLGLPCIQVMPGECLLWHEFLYTPVYLSIEFGWLCKHTRFLGFPRFSPHTPLSSPFRVPQPQLYCAFAQLSRAEQAQNVHRVGVRSRPNVVSKSVFFSSWKTYSKIALLFRAILLFEFYPQFYLLPFERTWILLNLMMSKLNIS